MAAAAKRQAKRQSTAVVSVVAPGGTRSAVERIAEYSKRYWSAHYFLGREDYTDALNARHRFFNVAGEPLKTEQDVKDAIARDGMAVSFE